MLGDDVTEIKDADHVGQRCKRSVKLSITHILVA